MTSSLDPQIARRAAHERARQQNQVRVASVLSAHGALFSSLRAGILRMDDQLDETHLVPMLSVSRNAVRSALRLLAAEGAVSRAPRNGTVVVADPIDVPLHTALGWDPQTYPSRTLTVTDARWVASTPMTRHHLRTDEAEVHLTEAVEAYHGQPVMLYARFARSEGHRRPLVAGPGGDFATLFEQTYGSPLSAIDCWVEAKGADEGAAGRLQIAPGTPLIVKSRVLWSADGTAREFSITHYVAAQVVLSAAVDLADPSHALGAKAPAPRQLADRDDAACPSYACSESDPAAPAAARRRSAPELHTELRAAIREGMFEVGDRLNEEEVAAVFGASRNTVRLVLAQLVEEGLVHRSRRDGTVVTSAVADYTLNAGMPYPSDEMHRYHDEHLVSVRMPTPPFVAGLLRTESARIDFDEYLVYRDGRPMTAYIRYAEPAATRRPLTSTNGDDFQSLFVRAYGVRAGLITHSLHAVRSDEQVARRLDVPPGTILLLSERIIHDVHGRPRELSHSYHLATHVSLASHHELDAA